MEGWKDALEDFAREAVALYGSEAPKMLLHRAGIDQEYGDHVSAKTWREIAVIAERIVRRIDAQPKSSSAQPQASRTPRRVVKPRRMLRKTQSGDLT